MDVLRERVVETVKNLGEHIDKIYTTSPRHGKSEIFRGSFKHGVILRSKYPDELPKPCRFAQLAHRRWIEAGLQ